jgi:hypothetical protein
MTIGTPARAAALALAALVGLAGCETTAPVEEPVPEGGALPPAYYGETPPPVYYGPPPVVYHEYWYDPFWPRFYGPGDVIIVNPAPSPGIAPPPSRRPLPGGAGAGPSAPAAPSGPRPARPLPRP